MTPYPVTDTPGALQVEWPAAVALGLAYVPPIGPPSTVAEARFHMVTVGPWHVMRSLRAAVTALADPETLRVYALDTGRTMHAPRESGYVHFGRISYQGRKHRTWSSSTLVEFPDGRLADVSAFRITLAP